MKQPIYVCGYPKSGTTWLARLIADTLNSSIGGSVPSQDDTELAAIKRDGDYIIRKGHYQIIRNYHEKPHTITLDMIANNPTFFIVRDPRDIAVSAAYYHGKSFNDIVDSMINGSLYGLGRWDDYVGEWIYYNCEHETYEYLIEDTFDSLRMTLNEIYDFNIDDKTILSAIENQTFDKTKQRYKDNSLNNKLMRKGIVGSYKTELSKSLIERINNEFGDTMEWLGYETT